jgi:hypothetical protein
VPITSPQEVRKGDHVIFKLPDGGSGGQITFVGPSPLLAMSAKYNVMMPVTAEHDPKKPEKNRFKFSCSGMIDGKEFSTDSGGEIEIIRT